ncbi:hypothetical protein GCM10009639_30070 [Kitasatospora putterlickiae]|uniref:Uncharacterized protein n=1 Tax=Kitasatospora putterlickiae TaxID=221725 RepID=A0ABN1Y1D6_9ACTN
MLRRVKGAGRGLGCAVRRRGPRADGAGLIAVLAAMAGSALLLPAAPGRPRCVQGRLWLVKGRRMLIAVLAATARTGPGCSWLGPAARPYAGGQRGAGAGVEGLGDLAGPARPVAGPLSRGRRSPCGSGGLAGPGWGSGTGREQDGTGFPCGRDGRRHTVEDRNGPARTAGHQKEFPS